MAKEKDDFFGREMQKHLPEVGAKDVAKGVGEFVKEMFPGLSLSKVFHDVTVELKQQAAHGSHELASALFRGDGFVLYPRQNHDVGQGLQQEREEKSHVQQLEQEKSRGGMER